MNKGVEIEEYEKSEKIESILVDAWEEFKKYYDEKAKIYIKSPNYKEWKKNISEGRKGRPAKETEDEHWICWNEHDLMVHIGRFFYNEISKHKDLENIELHFDEYLKKRNFKDYSFEENLDRLKEGLTDPRFNPKGRIPKPDLIIAQENSPEPFLLCAEAKYFHTAVEFATHGTRTLKDAIDKDINTLRAIKKLGVAKKVVFMLFDDYYYLRAQQELEKIEPLLSEFELDNNRILRHNTQAKKRLE